MEITMTVYRLYLANVRRQKVSGYWHVPANSFNEAQKLIREANPHIDWLNLELVEEA
jgi:hypothetical protein